MDLADIRLAQQRIAPFIKRTPLELSETLSRRLNTNIYVKYELFQRTGSFKARGAFNKILSLDEQTRTKGVVAVSGGNHAQAVAYASKVTGIPSVIVMPESTPANYVEATRGYGAAVDLRPSISEAFEAVKKYEADGMTFIHPFDDPVVMAGQGTLGLEIVEDLGNKLTDVVVSIGGGGLASGVASGIKGSNPGVKIWGVETQGAEAMYLALEAGHVVQMTELTSIAKTLSAPAVSEATLRYAQELFESVTVVPDREAVEALVYIAERLKVLTEPAASCTLAAAERLRENFTPDSQVVLIFCGGNQSINDLCRYLSSNG
jgi:threonine dehydratase